VTAALTGHMVLSTLHTNDAPSTVNRLVNMGVESFLVASSVNLVCAQRLVRRICEQCKEPHAIDAERLVEAGADPDEVAAMTTMIGRGCDRCGKTGYKGRVGLFEVMEMTDKLRNMVITGAPVTDIRDESIGNGMVTLRRSGLKKVAEGITTLEEVVRETVM
jgi:type IV pilus assembly protein PilB